MNLSEKNIEALKELLEGKKRVVILSHTNPDGDALGSSIAWKMALQRLGHQVEAIVPNAYPYYLEWIPTIKDVIIYRNDEAGVAERAVAEADIIFSLDFHTLSRLDALGDIIDRNQRATRVLIDHHLNPAEEFDIMFSYPEASSTSYLIYCLIEQLWGAKSITREQAEALYAGMMTDTGNFSFSTLTPHLFRAVANLAETGIDIPQLYNNVYNSFTEGRARLFGYVINRKMKLLRKGTVAHLSLTEEEMRRFWFQQGDNEGFVNYPLTIKKMRLSAIFTEHHDFIRVSLRSRGRVDVNLFAQRYFNGGGHKNAAGGKSFVSMAETIKHFEKAVEEFAAEGLL
ncbi:MAG: bifunctional oligoribonuclease/PAP phosphatase NrnA [Alistipes sp.]|nr:bifunctional oligoribonuclease/PAP phosphatase NrnA [Alistipes sp.]MDO5497733.1 bifunctional oligoribonuclease/PAP phosphatase NrnA [Alistipes sp.]